MRKAIFLAIANALCPADPNKPKADISKNTVRYVDLWNCLLYTSDAADE